MPHLDDIDLADLRPDHINRMLDEPCKPGADRRSKSPKGLSETTLQLMLQALRTGLDWAVRQRLVSHNPARDVDRAQREHTDIAVWTFVTVWALDPLSREPGSQRQF